jgi:hypothetical protein
LTFVRSRAAQERRGERERRVREEERIMGQQKRERERERERERKRERERERERDREREEKRVRLGDRGGQMSTLKKIITDLSLKTSRKRTHRNLLRKFPESVFLKFFRNFTEIN